MITIPLPNGLSTTQERWLTQNVSPRSYYLHNSIGGQGWAAKRQGKAWSLTLEDDKLASFFILRWP